MAVGLDPVARQRDFSAGMFRGVREDLIPENGAYDITNGLLDNDGAIYARGGSAYRSVSALGAWTPFIWDGYLTGGIHRTLIGTPAGFAQLNGDGTVTNLGSSATAPQRGAVYQGQLWLPNGAIYNGTTVTAAPKVAPYYAVVANRLLAAGGDRIDFTGIGTTTFGATDFHQVPDGVQIIGLQGLRDAAVVFTTGGVWVISNMAYNLTDSSGNVQQREDRYSSDLVLWGDAGIAAWEGGLVVPAVDGVWQMALGVASEAPTPFRRVSMNIDGLYREYVRLGYQPGQACVWRSHYLLPILNGQVPVDMLVCRLDAKGQPWTHLGGFGAQLAAVTVRMSSTSPRSPELIGGHANVGRVLTLNYFDPSAVNSLDADGSAPSFSLQPRDYTTGPLNENTIVKLRLGYDLADPGSSNPIITATQISGREVTDATMWGAFNWNGANWSPSVASTSLSGGAPEDPYGYQPYTWHLAKRERFGRFRLDCTQAKARLTIRWLEMFVRSNGRM